MADKIRVELELEDDKFTSRVERNAKLVEEIERNFAKGAQKAKDLGDLGGYAAGQVSKLGDNALRTSRSMRTLDSRTKSFLGTMRDVSIVMGAASIAFNKISNIGNTWLGDIIRVNANFERLNALMSGLSKAADPVREAADNVAYLREQAKNTPFTINAISDAFVKMKATGIDPLDGSIRAYTDAVAAAGGTDEMLKRVSIAISQMSGKGVVQMEELRQQLGEAIPRATELMARSMGVSYAELVQALSTGRVEAKAALAGLRDELLRTFGGSGQRMMDTFNGMLSKTQSLFMDLAEASGSAGYFDAVKDQLEDFNVLLQSGFAKGFARELGSSLASVIGGLRSAIEWIFRFREEIMAVGQAIAYAFGARLLMSSLATIGTAVRNVTANFAALSTAVRDFANAQRLNSVATSLNGISGVAGGISRTTAAVRGLTGVLGILSATATTVVPIVGILGTAIVAAAEYFDIFGTKAQSAWQELETFGVMSRRQVEGAVGKINELAEEYSEATEKLERLERQREYYAGTDKESLLIERINQTRQEVVALASAYEEARAKYMDWMGEAEEIEADQAANNHLRSLRRTMTQVQGEYDRRQIALSETYEQEKLMAKENGRDVHKIEAEYRKQQFNDRQQLYADQLAALQSFNQQYTTMLSSPDKAQALLARRITDEVAAQSLRIKEMAEADRIASGTQLVAKTDNVDKGIEKTQTMLDNLRAKAMDYAAELKGTNGEVEKLRYLLIEAEKHGSPNTEKLRVYIDEVLEAQEQVTALKDMLDGRSKFEKELQRQRMKAEEALFDAQNRGLTEYEKFLKKIQDGFYTGIYKSDQEKMVEALGKALQTTGENSTAAANAMASSIFSSSMKSRAGSFLTVLDRMVKAFASMKSLISGISMTDLMSGLNGYASLVPEGAGGGVSSGAGKIGGPVQAKDLPPEAQALLAAISSGGIEGAGYNTMYGGSSFASFADHPRIRHLIRGGRNAGKTTSAAGRYQFLEGTWDGLAKELNLQDFSPANQDRAAWHLAVKDYFRRTQRDLLADLQQGNFEMVRRGLGGVGNDTTWEGLQKVNGATLQSKYEKAQAQQAMPYSDVNYAGQRVGDVGDVLPQYKKEIDEIDKKHQQAAKIMADNALTDSYDDAVRKLKEMNEQVEGLGKNEAAFRKAVREGAFGPDTNPDSERYEQTLAKLKEVDAAEERLANKRKLRTQTDKIENDIKDLTNKAVEAEKRLAAVGSNTYQPSDGFVQLRTNLDEYLNDVEAVYTRDSEQYRAALAQKEAALKQFKNREITELTTTAAREAEQRRVSMMTESQQRQYTLQQTISYYQSLLQNFEGNAQQRLEIERRLQEAIKQLRAEAANAGPMAKQMQAWADIGNNMEQAMTGWLDGGIDAIANFVATGKADFKSLAQSIIKDITKIALKWAVSKMMAGVGGDKGGAGGKAAGAGGKGGGGKSLMKAFFPIAHTGGIAGARGLGGKRVNPAAFMGAPKFHTGGIIKGMGLGPDEVPIIAKKGEGVFTPEQMNAMGKMGGSVNNQAVTVQSNVTVNAQGGSPEQNADLAKQVSKQVEGSVRQLVVKELLVQRRPGGLLGAS